MRAPTLTIKRAKTARRRMTLPEVVLWSDLRGGRLGGLRFRRQHPIGPVILDFYLPSRWTVRGTGIRTRRGTTPGATNGWRHRAFGSCASRRRMF